MNEKAMIELLKNKKIGIWGFGITGQSILRYLSTRVSTITIFDWKELSPEQISLIHDHHGHIFLSDLPSFLKHNDYIIASPGIDLDPYQDYAHKFIAELDLFHAAHQKKTIAVTGSAGKTSITHLLDQLLHKAHYPVTTGGNIGTGMLDMLSHDNTPAYLLELSSFQLEQCMQFAPDLAIITNLYPNHLDRHKTMERYFQAKYRLIAHQKQHHNALLPITLLEQCNAQPVGISARSFFSWDKPNPILIQQLRSSDRLFYTDDAHIITMHHHQEQSIFALSDLPSLSYKENWLIIVSTLYLLNMPLNCIKMHGYHLTLPEHRLEKIMTVNGIDFYNDSKSTTNQATIAAVHSLQGRPIHLFLGGLSKGVDRTPLIRYLQNRVVHVYCFGKEAEQLQALCAQMNIPSSYYSTLEHAFALCTQKIYPQDQVVLSPGGASYDLFKDYEERGHIFKDIVRSFKNAQNN